jgi:PAS domain S-box-containing protein
VCLAIAKECHMTTTGVARAVVPDRARTLAGSCVSPSGILLATCLLACLVTAFVTTVAGAETKGSRTPQKIVAAVPSDFPPTYFRDSITDKPAGFAIDVMDAVASRAGLQVEYVFGKQWEDILSMVENGTADVVPNLTIDENRKKRFAFTLPTETIPISYIVRSKQSVSGLVRGMKVGVIQGSVAQTYLASREDITVIPYPGLQQLLFDLLAGHVDIILTATPNITKLALEAGVEKSIRVLDPPVTEGLRGMALRRSDAELLGRLDEAINEFVGSDAYRDIYAKWWGKPKTFWNIGRTVVAALSILAFAIIVMAVWRYKAMNRMNREIREALEQAERERLKNHAILESVSDGISIHDMNLKILYQNPMHIEMMGKHSGEFCYQAFAKNETVCEGCPVTETVRDGQPAMSVRDFTVNGETKILEVYSSAIRDESGEMTSVITCVRDITARTKYEEERLENLLFIETLLKHSPVGIRVFDGDSGKCVLVNNAAVEIAGGDVETMKGQNFRELPSWRGNGLLEAAESVLSDGSDRVVQTDMHTSFDKKVSVAYYISRFIVKEKPHLLVIGRNITDEKRLAEENKKIEAQMLHVQKLESLGVLAGGIAHDFNNILMAVLGNAELALKRLSPESPIRDNLKNIEIAAQRAADLACQMLAYSGKGRFIIEPLDLNSLITEMHHILEVSISKKAVMRIDLAHKLPLLEADATQIRQIIMNLVINASEAIGDSSGVIAITTGAMDCDQAYLSSEVWLNEKLEEGQFVYLEVTDTGCGMDRDTAAKIFDPFFTTKFTGRGLGMAAVIGIVRGHMGAIKVYSEPGKGTSFKVLLPAMRKNSTASLRVPKFVKPLMGSGTVLLVDDEESVRALGRDMLKELGFSVLTAENGVVALEIFRESKEEILCVILDLTMPRMDGEQTFCELRRMKPDVRVIMSSGYNQMEVTQKFVGKGLAGFIQKPYSLVGLGQKLRDAIGEQ